MVQIKFESTITKEPVLGTSTGPTYYKLTITCIGFERHLYKIRDAMFKAMSTDFMKKLRKA